MKSKWTKKGERLRFKDGITEVVHKEFYYEDVNDTITFTILNINNGVMVVPVTEDNEFIIIRQFRAGLEEDAYEFPGGGINKGEEPLKAAVRELKEEAGAAAEEMIPLSVMDSNSAFISSRCHVFFAKNTRLIGEQKLDKFEDTEIIKVKYNDLMEMVRNGSFCQSISLAALGLFLARA